MNKLLQYIPAILVLSLMLSACSSDTVQRTLEPERIAFGKINQINVLCDQDVWDGPIGDSIRFYYGAAYPILPQPEPIFDLRHITWEEIQKDPLQKELRTFLVVGNLNDKDSPVAALIRRDLGTEKITESTGDNGYGNSVAKNHWAQGQLMVYLYGEGHDKVVQNVQNSYTAVAKRLNQADAEMVEATAYFNGDNVGLASEVEALMDVKLRIPETYFAALMEPDVVWLRRETSDVSSNIMLTKVPYTDESQLSRDGLKAIRNELGKKYVSSTLPDTYMRINDVDLPLIVETTRLNGDYALEARGIWDIVNDYMGGAFVSYLVYDPTKQELLFMDGFVHAPGKDKRDLIQQLDYILNTAVY